MRIDHIRAGGRDEQFHLLKLEFDERAWSAQFTSLTDHREDQQARRETERVNQYKASIKGHLIRHGGEASLAQLAEAAGTKSSRAPFQRVIDELCESGQCERFIAKSGNNRSCERLKVKGQKSADTVL